MFTQRKKGSKKLTSSVMNQILQKALNVEFKIGARIRNVKFAQDLKPHNILSNKLIARLKMSQT